MSGTAVGLAGLRTDARRFELYVRLSLYALLGFELLFAFGLGAGSVAARPALLAYAAAMVVQTGLNIAVCRWAITTMRRSSARPRGREPILLAGWLLVGLGLAAATAVLITDEVVWRLIVLVVIMSPVAAVCPVLHRRGVLLAGAATVVVLTLVLLVGLTAVRGWLFVLGMVTGMIIAVAALIFTFWTSGWMLRVVWALDDARGQATQLAIAEERLRIARDLHDVFGRTLATVAVKSELAAELVRRGRAEQAAGEIAAVRQIADDAGREVRQVVSGVRAADLATELAGARALLDAAGIRTDVTGDVPAHVEPAVAAALAWALREGVTNVIRHSRATWCRISLSGGAPVRLQIENDGAAGGSADHGHGLVGMAERVEAVGGRVSHRNDGGTFVLLVAVGAA